jgi:chemotaxis-related protein WspD
MNQPMNQQATAPAIDDCWNRIGVSGDQSCALLAQHVHCRNCDVYSAAAQRNLQRPIDAAYRREWAGHFSEKADQRAALDQSALVFRIGREWLALPTRAVDSVAPLATGHRLPHRSAPGLLGVVSVGGKLTPLMSLGAMLGIDEHDTPRTSGRHVFARLLVMQWEGRSFALPVADLHGIERYAQDALAAPAATINKGLDRFLTGVMAKGEMRIGVLDEALIGHQLARLLR